MNNSGVYQSQYPPDQVNNSWQSSSPQVPEPSHSQSSIHGSIQISDYDPQAAKQRIHSILNDNPTQEAQYQATAMLKNMEPLDPVKRDPGYNFKDKIKENNEVDRRPFIVKALPALLGILLCLLVTLVSYFILPGMDTDNLSTLQLHLAEGRAKIGSWVISIHSVVAAIVTIQGMLLGLAVTIATPLLTWYYITRIGVPYTFIDSSRSIVGNLHTLQTADFKPYVFVSIIYLVATVFRSSDNIALSSFITEKEVLEAGQVPTINNTNMYDHGFYDSIATEDDKHVGSDFVFREGSQPFHAAVGSVSNGYSRSDIRDGTGSYFLVCPPDSRFCSGRVTVYADYNITCTSSNTELGNKTTVTSNAYGIFGKGPLLGDGRQVYYRIGVEWIVRIDNLDQNTSFKVVCTMFSAKTERDEDSLYGTIGKNVLNVYSIPNTHRTTSAFADRKVLLPYDTPIPYTGEDFPIADPTDETRTPLPYYFMGIYSLMVQRSAVGLCDYSAGKKIDRCGDNRNFLFDFPFEPYHNAAEIQYIIGNITEKFYQNMYLLRFDQDATVLIDGINYYQGTVTNKVPMMAVITAFNLFSIGILAAAITVIATVQIPLKLGVLQLSILSYRSRLFEGEQFSSEEQLKERFVVKVVEHEGIFWLKRQDR
ncbi:hypothetical protein HDV01_004357 [Terramyces sp. JEL0728]|nr:hypothetical protein HDV01_004357 [Terramyces sp. JEL0728]